MNIRGFGESRNFMKKFTKLFLKIFAIFICIFVTVNHLGALPAPLNYSLILPGLVRLEAGYIQYCQFYNLAHPAHGAINNIYGQQPTWIVPRENALAILGLLMATDILREPSYAERAQLAADYLVRVQHQMDGAWYDQYSYEQPVVLSKSPTQTAEVMIAFYKLGFRPDRYLSMKKGAQFLLSCQDPANKGGNDDGLLGGGKDENGQYNSWRWTSDNAFAYWALKAAEQWAMIQNDLVFADLCRAASLNIITGIDNYLYISDVNSPDFGVWYRVVDQNDQPIDPNFHEWINYAPQMLDLPAQGVGQNRVGEWIHTNLQKSDGACVWNDGNERDRKSPGFSFQASLCWLDLGQNRYADSARNWTLRSGLWQKTLDPNGIKGGWIDWIQGQIRADWWLRFIDTSFYAISSFAGGYNFQIP
ncbi:MAG: hypothetical protein Q8O13_05415 [Candidatus Omnitrophota bacterium]|nr:hypothetical protein [Candidatus Omnitrophota bacterium]